MKDKCRECVPPHPWSLHENGRGCQVRGCCCQSDKAENERLKAAIHEIVDNTRSSYDVLASHAIDKAEALIAARAKEQP